jgi:hypothetical protein
MKKLYTTLTTLVLLLAALVANAQTKVEGTLENDGHKMKWSISGVTVTEKEQPKLEKVNFGGTDDGDLKQELSGTVAPGALITADLRKVSGKNKPKVYIQFDYYKEGSPFAVYAGVPIKLEEKEDMSKNFKVPSNATEVLVMIIYRTPDPHPRAYALEMEVVGRFKVGNKAPEPEPQPQPQPKQEEDCNCNPKIDSRIRFNDFYGEVKIRPDCEEDDSYELVDLDTQIWECDRIKTEEESGAILGLEDMSTYVIKPESVLIIHTYEEEVPRIVFIAGCLWANVKKMMEGKSIKCEMSECIAGTVGTIFALEESSQGSKVWVFAGKMEVTNKKTGKKTELNAGQNITVKGKNNNVQSFNIEDGAKQFGIPMDHITNHYTNKPISKINLESICKPNKGTAPKKEGNKASGKNTTSGKKLTINKKTNTDKDTNAGKKPTINKKSSTDKDTNADKDTKAGKKPTIGKKSNTDKNATTPKGQYARYGAKCGIVKRVDEGSDIRMYYTTWWDDYGRLERSEITRCEEKVGGKWKSTSAPQIKNIIVDDKHYMYSKSTGWKQLKNDETNFLGSGSKMVDGCKLEKNGTATVNGKPCDIFKGKRNGTTIEYYIWEGVPMKRVEKDSEGTTSTTVESIELPASVDASLFEIPNVKR